MAGAMYNRGMYVLSSDAAGAQEVWDTATIKVKLVDSNYVPNKDHDYIDNSGITANVITGSNYSDITLACSGPTLDDANDRINFKVTTSTFTFSSLGSGNTPAYAIVYVEKTAASSSPLISYLELASPNAPNGGDYQIQFNNPAQVVCHQSA